MEPTQQQIDKWVDRASAHAFAIDEGSPIYLVYEKLAKLAYQAGADDRLRLCVEWIRSHERLDRMADSRSRAKESAEQQARDMLDRMGVPNAQSFSAGDLVELANLIAMRPKP